MSSNEKEEEEEEKEEMVERKELFIALSDNPHLRQVVTPAEYVPLYPLSNLKRTLGDDSPRLTYRRRRGEMKSLCHWGQKKLLMSEIEFLTMYVEPSLASGDKLRQYTCLYVGASPGDHISYLCYLFPQVHFVLVDPRPFCNHLADPELRPSNATLLQQTMTSEIIDEYKNKQSMSLETNEDGTSLTTKSLLFVSDIRSADWQVINNHDAMDQEVQKDMSLQRDWHIALKPLASMLKFRLPWSAGCTKYLEGKLFLPVYGPVGTSEARLVVSSCDLNAEREYDHQTHWEQMFYFNTISRYAFA